MCTSGPGTRPLSLPLMLIAELVKKVFEGPHMGQRATPLERLTNAQRIINREEAAYDFQTFDTSSIFTHKCM